MSDDTSTVESEAKTTDNAIHNLDPTKIYLISFSYNYGPLKCNIPAMQIYNLRKAIRNPWRDPELRKLTGLDPAIQAFVKNCFKYTQIESKVRYNILYNVTVIGIGCNSGKHRSVAVVELLKEALGKTRAITIIHRDLDS